MAVLTSNRSKVRQADFSGGQNSGDNPSNIGEAQAELLENCIITERGRCEQRKGLQRVGDNPDSLVSIWTFDDSSSVDDKSTNDGTDTDITYVVGKFGKAASFNGSTSRITVPANSSIDANGKTQFALSCWIYVDSTWSGSNGRIFDKVQSSSEGYRAFLTGLSGGSTTVNFFVNYSVTNANLVTSTTISADTWHKLLFIHNTDKSLDIVINGTLASYSTDTTGSGTIDNDSANVFTMGNRTAGNVPFKGYIDDARFYNAVVSAEDYELKSILGITRFNVGSTYDKVIRAKDTSIQELNTNFKTWDNITGLTSLTAGLTTNFIQGMDRLFILNGTDNVFSIDSSLTVTDEGNTNTDFPKSTIAEWASNNRMFASGSLTVANRDIVWFSNALDPQTWDRTSNLFYVARGRGGKITQIKMFKEFELIVYKDSNIYVLNMEGTTPLTDWQVKPLSVSIGCPAGRTVCDIGNDHIFLANDGVRLLSRTTFDKLRVGVISEPIQDIINSINQDSIQNSVGFFENGLYLLGVPVGTSTTPNKFMIWDSIAAIRNGDPNSAWTTIPTDVWNLSCMTSYGFGDNLKTIVGGEARAFTLCYKVLSGNTDNGNTVNQTIIGREQDYGDPFLKKIFDPAQFIAQTGSDATYNYYMDIDRTGFTSIETSGVLASGLVTPFVTPATTGGSEQDLTNVRTKFIGRGNSARVKVTNTVYNKRPSFLEYTMFTRPYQGRI